MTMDYHIFHYQIQKYRLKSVNYGRNNNSVYHHWQLTSCGLDNHAVGSVFDFQTGPTSCVIIPPHYPNILIIKANATFGSEILPEVFARFINYVHEVIHICMKGCGIELNVNSVRTHRIDVELRPSIIKVNSQNFSDSCDVHLKGWFDLARNASTSYFSQNKNFTHINIPPSRVEKPPENSTKHSSKEVCYDDLGCFSLEYPWNSTDRPFNYLPDSPKTINAKFYLRNRSIGDNRILITSRPNMEVNVSLFDPDRWVVFITHGFFGSAALNNWITEMEEALLTRGDVNVISCDWSSGSRMINYLQAAANARVVGAEIARLVKFLLNKNLAASERIHLIGQSLGAHVMSYAADRLKTVARLTGLDPAQPGFEGAHPAVRLDLTDAEFVDVIHTNAKPFFPDLGLGIREPIGHVDFFVNGGVHQPGCFQTIKEHLKQYPTVMSILSAPFTVIGDFISCDHRRAHEIYIEALKSECSFWARKWIPFGPPPKSQPCTPEICQEMGKYTRLLPARGSFYIHTRFPAPYCVYDQDSEDNMVEYLLGININFYATSGTYPAALFNNPLDHHKPKIGKHHFG